jgi:hypothetical protein
MITITGVGLAKRIEKLGIVCYCVVRNSSILNLFSDKPSTLFYILILYTSEIIRYLQY